MMPMYKTGWNLYLFEVMIVLILLLYTLEGAGGVV